MTKFYLVDHSLRKLGGHHYEYALHVLGAAERAGCEPILAANREFDQANLVPENWKVISPYHHTSNSRHSIVGKRAKWLARPDDRDDQISWLGRRLQSLSKAARQASEWRRLFRGNVRSRSFAQGTMRVLQKFPLAAGDQVFVPTLNEFDLSGALRVCESDPSTALADWHFQFHFDIEPDREVDAWLLEYRLGLLRDLFARCCRNFPRHRFHFYTTTERLAEQYNRLGSAPFQCLPYPVNPCFSSAKIPHKAGMPLRVTCIGGIRKEKGIDALPALLRALRSDIFDPGKAQLVVQAQSENQLPAGLRGVPGASEACSVGRMETTVDQSVAPISLIPYPLDTETYQRIVVESDIGLLLYHGRQYRSRASGVLTEFLSAGVPVLVPAGSWLSDQIAEEIYRHQEALPEMMTRIGGEVDCAREHDGGRSLPIPHGATHALLAIRWQPADDRGSYCRVRARQIDAAGQEVGRTVEILSLRQNGLPSTALVLLQPSCKRMEWECESAFIDCPLKISDFLVRFVAPRTAGEVIPWGAVGLIFSDAEQTPGLLRNLIENFPHYERTAGAFAPQFFAEHSPDSVVRRLIQRKNHSENRRAV